MAIKRPERAEEWDPSPDDFSFSDITEEIFEGLRKNYPDFFKRYESVLVDAITKKRNMADGAERLPDDSLPDTMS